MKFYRFRIERVFSKSDITILVVSGDTVDLRSFIGITPDKLSKIMELMDETIVVDQLRSPKIQKLIAMGYTENQAEDIVTTFFNFMRHIGDTRIITIIENSKLNETEKKLMKNAFEDMSKKIDKNKIDELEKQEEIEEYGHLHLHTLNAKLECRPMFTNDKKLKLIGSVVIEGEIQDSGHENPPIPINFQLKVSSFEELVGELTKELSMIKTQIKELKEKMGEDNVYTR